MLRNITNSTKNIGNGWMNGRNDAYSRQITTSTVLNPRHGLTPLDYKALDHQSITVLGIGKDGEY